MKGNECSPAAGTPRDYRTLTKIKVLTDRMFADVQNGKKPVKAALRALKDDLLEILTKIY